jgi:hypothetical protein
LPAASRRRLRPTLRKATRLGVALAALLFGFGTTVAGAATDYRAAGRSAGGDRALALRVAHVLLARPLDLQLTRVRCEQAAGASYCGLTLSGVKFHGRVDTAAFRTEVDQLVHGAFAVDPAIAEVDLWVTVPANAGKGAIVSGDFAMPSSATVFATTVPRGLAGSPSGSDNVFWDPKFRSELAQGSDG